MEEAKKILLIGAGGHCMSVLDSLLSSYDYQDIGIIDKKIESEQILGKSKKSIMGIPIIGHDEELELLFNKGYKEAFITVGSIGNVSLRKKLYQKIKEIGFKIPNIIDKTSVVSSNTSLGEGVYVGKKAIINASTKVGNLAIINTSAVIEHECDIEDFVHVAPGTVLCGNVCIGSETHIGAGSVIKQGVRIGANTMIGMGSVVIKDIEENTIAYGNPCSEENYE
jgi:sugar O-acyltransferase (sialic acid O-acetyltransferase NeuD family)